MSIVEDFEFDSLKDQDVRITTVFDGTFQNGIGKLECCLLSEESQEHSAIPIFQYSKTLKNLRKESKKISTCSDEIDFAHQVKNSFAKLSQNLKMSDDHFQIDTSGAPLLIQEGKGEHIILPTHFENGSYFSHPHADHHLSMAASELPKIKIGKYIRFGKGVAMNAGGNLRIDDYAWLSPGASLLKQDHNPYGRPSVGSRTVGMTHMPSIHLSEYSWIGREAMMGWDADYVGKASIVATRSFVNTWVSDYSITGNFGKVIQYLPYKAALLELLKPSFEEVLSISDWTKVQSRWLNCYRKWQLSQESESLAIFKMFLGNQSTKNLKILDINPTVGNETELALKYGHSVDILSNRRNRIPFILQKVKNTGSTKARLRSEYNGITLPFVNAHRNPFSQKTNGYDFVFHRKIDADNNITSIKKRIDEADRVLIPGGHIFVGCLNPNLIDAILAVSRESAFDIVDDQFSGQETILLLKKRVESKKVTNMSVPPSLIVSGFARNHLVNESEVG
ncbi:acyltransferase [Fluviispira vulneris]|uniref:acyltransferase n=1 Tax=Fluviispira vulneris TaxID=2763012 RepID=UPI001646C694|nr:hypothetical protein [Fluviispira vulneris]